MFNSWPYAGYPALWRNMGYIYLRRRDCDAALSASRPVVGMPTFAGHVAASRIILEWNRRGLSVVWRTPAQARAKAAKHGTVGFVLQWRALSGGDVRRVDMLLRVCAAGESGGVSGSQTHRSSKHTESRTGSRQESHISQTRSRCIA